MPSAKLYSSVSGVRAVELSPFEFGSQGEPPSHPELLDWLACELRDVALAAAGLLDGNVGGPSVKPYQPAGYWDYLNFPKRTYQADTGTARYRRGIYVHWQRQYLHPALMVFDAPSREECTARRPRSNTPLQALVLLNDPQFVEAARALAATTLGAAGPEPLTRARYMLRQAIGRMPLDAEVGVVADLAERQREIFAGDPAAAAGWPGVVRPFHVPPKAKRVIWLYMAGGMTHLDTFDHKPKLVAMNGRRCRRASRRGSRSPSPQVLRPAASLCPGGPERPEHLDDLSRDLSPDRRPDRDCSQPPHRGDQPRPGPHLHEHRKHDLGTAGCR